MSTPQTYLVGAAGTEFLQHALTTASDIKKTITEFQKDNTLKGGSVEPLLQLLDLHGSSRAVVFNHVLTALRSKLVERVRELSEEQLTALLEKIFPYIAQPALSDAVMAVLQVHPALPSTYLRALRSAPHVLAHCPLSVRQQVWRIERSLFEEFAEQLIQQHVANLVDDMMDNAPPSARRTTSAPLNELVTAIGDHQDLARDALQVTRRLFLNNENVLLCTARSDLVMMIHETGSLSAATADPAYRFAWVLDACVRSETISTRHVSELGTLLEKARAQLLGDMAMTAGDPHVMRMLARYTVQRLTKIADSETLPGEDDSLLLATGVMGLGEVAHALVKAQGRAVIPARDGTVSRVLCPILSTFLLDPAEPISVAIVESIVRSGVSRMLTESLILRRLQNHEFDGLEPLCESFAHLGTMIPSEKSFLRGLVTVMSNGPELCSARVRAAILDLLLLPYCTDEGVHHELLRLLINNHTKIPARDVVAYSRHLAEHASPGLGDVYAHLTEIAGVRCNLASIPAVVQRAEQFQQQRREDEQRRQQEEDEHEQDQQDEQQQEQQEQDGDEEGRRSETDKSDEQQDNGDDTMDTS
eukprot:TRINITY_DN1378_c0_g3_i2.p1 TRINITY_DN1378_c0_g3~~TRINITY_DN1378_c0_g3_i2.p1  ORF type:complete len:588 (-),score=135.86 TRINITY_DN1378_c0_g3_i2:316-2079(-)